MGYSPFLNIILENDDSNIEQKTSSAKTSRKQVASGLAKLLPTGILNGKSVLDYGGGKYDLAKIFAQKYNINLEIYDKFNRDAAHNLMVLSKKHYDMVTSNNVLNVLESEQLVNSVIKQIKKIAAGVPTMFTVYEGNKSGIGGNTKDGYQRNQKIADYLSDIKKEFGYAIKKGDMIFAADTKEVLDDFIYNFNTASKGMTKLNKSQASQLSATLKKHGYIKETRRYLYGL